MDTYIITGMKLLETEFCSKYPYTYTFSYYWKWDG